MTRFHIRDHFRSNPDVMRRAIDDVDGMRQRRHREVVGLDRKIDKNRILALSAGKRGDSQEVRRLAAETARLNQQRNQADAQMKMTERQVQNLKTQDTNVQMQDSLKQLNYIMSRTLAISSRTQGDKNIEKYNKNKALMEESMDQFNQSFITDADELERFTEAESDKIYDEIMNECRTDVMPEPLAEPARPENNRPAFEQPLNG